MDEVYFLTRFTPFWAIPIFLIAGEFAYLFWVRKKKKGVALCIILVLIAASCLVFYFWAGGPEKSVDFLKHFVRFYRD